ncbi:alpha/beta hydrolase [Agriterribacter sp.]|uniref:alpha/beta hydrolase n=1 Tax=Agriterribacter sp. TaxID=2821509 RepID=UPI002B58256E|nr:alpha/beta hydrolase-fold protein [Agriterribacter sp.]HTN07662.1 alpha/beta hydrolase-fold protein [Agriterribacter sp.]
MALVNQTIVAVKKYVLPSRFLRRDVRIDFFIPVMSAKENEMSLLLINDGQDMEELGLVDLLAGLYRKNEIRPLLCVGVHCGDDRKNEYGTAAVKDYKGRGAKAGLYTQFILDELFPFITAESGITVFKEKSFAGFSLGGLSALDIIWNHPESFVKAGVFSGSFWWRTRGLDEGYIEDTDRIMHAQIRKGNYSPWLKFFFETGTLDETEDRNKNGIIDSIDDTIGLIAELEHKGYNRLTDIKYLELTDGRHDVATWAKAMPEFLKWGWGKGM